MAMLAEPRQKKRYNLVPKGKPLFEDSDRYGTKMLEKMGWSKGKGLGSREDGQEEFVRVRYKNDANGLGFNERDDQWTEHEKHFNGLLDSLNGIQATTNPAGHVEAPTVGFGFKAKSSTKRKLTEKLSGQSLEEKSKNSKARVHYKKFTKGKDMSQYSEKDLANIFGKKETREGDNIFNQFKAYNAYDGDKKKDKDDDAKEDNMINTGVSIGDYFKVKMEALQQKKYIANGRNDATTEEETPLNKTKKHLSDDEEVANESTKVEKTPEEFKNQIVNTGVSVNDYFQMKMEALKRKKEASTVSEPIEEETPITKKKSKKQTDDVDTNESTVSSAETVKEVPRKKKKSKKQAAEHTSIEIEPEITSEEPPAKKNKKKNKSLHSFESIVVDSSSPSESPVDEIPLKKKKNKKRPIEDAFTGNDASTPTILPQETTNVPKKNKNKSKLTEEASSTTDSYADNIPSKKSKKNKSPSTEVSSQHISNPFPDNCLLDTHTISTFCAEKFRNIELPHYNGSSISDIIGYGYSENLQLKITTIKNDQKRIMQFWNGYTDKYAQSTPKKKIYSNYKLKVRRAWSEKKKTPKIKTKSLKRKNVFQCL